MISGIKLCLFTVAAFRFSQSSYNVTESDGVISVCIELVKGTLSEDIAIQLSHEGSNFSATCIRFCLVIIILLWYIKLLSTISCNV